ncbi:MAG: hypothetical protein IIC33_09020, partial [Chloroflexi bacterium]|nr:hypothetical protein [Chloroflexota bacterium]
MAEVTEILNKLIERTREQKVSWKTTNQPQIFVAVIGKISVMILVNRAGDPVLRVLNEEGEVIEALDSGIGAGENW